MKKTNEQKLKELREKVGQKFIEFEKIMENELNLKNNLNNTCILKK